MRKDLPHSQPTRTGLSLENLKNAFEDNLLYALGRPKEAATAHDLYMAAALTVRDRMWQRWINTANHYKESNARTVCYLSAEFLLGPHLANNMNNLGITELAYKAAQDLGLDIEQIIEQEEEPGLGNGGLGRLAACYLDSMATLEVPAIGYGIRYEFGIFDQEIRDGWQLEKTDQWLRNGNPWELPRPKLRFTVKFGGCTEQYADEDGHYRVRWIAKSEVNGMAYDTPILGYGVNTTNLLRLWKSEATESFNFHAFNTGDYYGAVNDKVLAENITKVLYPNDEPAAGKELRLKQQYFFVSCSLQDMIRLQLESSGDLNDFHKKYAAQLNDTHPAIAVAELMRLLVDEHRLGWEQAWEITRNTFAYTNHTLLPEALETWSVELFQRLLPRHLEIIYEINTRFLQELRLKLGKDHEAIERLSLIDEHNGRRIRMANLATVGSFAVNGVAAMHSELVKTTILKDFYRIWPEKFHNVTNGVTPRRFVQLSNPGLASLLTKVAGDDWSKDMDKVRALESYANDSGFQTEWQTVKRDAKVRLAKIIHQRTNITINPDSLFDIQVKRIHEYKRQHLNILHVLTLYHRIKSNPSFEMTPRTFIFGGKAAPGYFMAKLIIKLINSVGDLVNNDPHVNQFIKVVFFPDFNVKNAQNIYPAADLSEQISLAGKEASGTGNMKFSMNGALTIGTLDGANVEIRTEVGEENFFLFGLTEKEVNQTIQHGYHPRNYYDNDTELKTAIDHLHSGLLSNEDRSLFHPLTENLLQYDPFLVLADYRSYIDCQGRVSNAYSEPGNWNQMSILNVARIAKFSSDRAIAEYCDKIWNVTKKSVEI